MPKKILIIEDEPDLVKVVAFRLKQSGYAVIPAVNGRQGLELAKKEMPDLILLDLLLPVMNGYEFVKQLHLDETAKNIPIILFTASVVHDVGRKARELGACDYIIKPFEPQDLLEKIKKYVGD